ncbi:hypothetical protein, partial [Staphylococcus aureus]|uniref:hypothetical protein n=1 Tax=Staphylococcus aureus TaxID=1280 RepID=UPI00301C76D0
AWLAWQAHRHATGQPPFDWAYAWALRERDAARFEDRFARLQAEMSALGAILETTGETALSKALASWSRRLSERSSSPGRSPEPLGLLHLAGVLRRNPAMADMRLLGSCQPPGWVEAWTLTGVRRIPWEPGMSLD